MVALLPVPVLQFSDADGKPYAGGSIATFVPGTTTPVTTWSESTGTTANSNPVILDAAGRCTIYASGAVRMQLTDALGNLVFDRPSNTLVSTAMAPVCLAPDIPTAQGLLGIVNSATTITALTTGLTAETARAEAAEATLTTNLAAETTARTAAIAGAAAAILAETTRAEAAEAAIAGSTAKSGSAGPTSSSGHIRVTFATPFPTACTSFVSTALAAGLLGQSMSAQVDRYGADVWSITFASAPQAGLYFSWVAYGN
jgi:hypothetical protein